MTSNLIFSEAFSVSAGFLMAMLAGLLWSHRRERPEWGLGWIALAMGTGASVNLLAPTLITGAFLDLEPLSPPGAALLLALMLGFASLAALWVGVRCFSGRAPARPLRDFVVLWVLSQAGVLLAAIGQWRTAGDLTAAAVLLYCAWLALTADRREPGQGYWVVALALALQPAALAVLLALGIDAREARYFAAVPYGMAGLALLSVGLARMRNETALQLSGRQEAEQALRASESALRRSQEVFLALVQQAPLPMSYSPLDRDGKLTATHWNRAWYATFGHPQAALEGVPGDVFTFWEDEAKRERYIATAVERGQVEAVPARLRHADGSVRLCELYGRIVDTGRERFLMTTFIDVTQQRADAQRLKDFETMVRSTDDGMLLVEDGVIVAANPAAQRLFGMAEGAIVGQTPAALSPPLQPDGRPSEPAAREHAARTSNSGSERFLWEHRRGDGSCFSAQVTLSAVDGYPQRLIAVVRDVTQEQAAAQALQQSEARLRFVIAVSNTGVWEVDRRDGVWWSSPEYFTMLGVDPAPYTEGGRVNATKIWFELVHPEDGDRVHQRFQQYLAQGSVGLYEEYFRMRHADGSWVWIWSRGQTLRHPDGSLNDVTVGLHINVTEQRLAEQRLRDSQALLAATFDLLPEPLALADVDEGRYIDVNRMWVERLGIPREAAIGRTSIELGMWRDPAERTAVRDLLARSRHIEDAPVSFLRSNGELMDCEASARRIEVGGRSIDLWLTRDVTEQKQVQALAEMSRIQLKANLDNTPAVAVQWFDRDGRVLYWNPASEALYGIAASEVLWQLPVGFLYQDQAEFQGLLDVFRQIEDTGRAVGPYEVDVRRRDGRVVSVLASTFAIPMGDGRTCFVCMDVDITERKRLEVELRELAAQLEDRVAMRTAALEARNEELRQTQVELVRSDKLAALGALVAGVAHELNTPIGNATMVASTLAGRQREFEAGMVDGLRRSALQGFLQHTREITEVLDRNLLRAAELIASFKQLAVDQTSDQRRRFALQDVVGEVLLAVSPTLKRARVEPEVAIEPGLTMDSYPGPLGQVLMNLINNALMHAFEPEAPGRLWIRAQPQGTSVVLTLRDDGKGIAPEHLNRIFDPFFTTRLGQGGSGLGLHIVHNLVTGPLGGRIDVASPPGEGTVFEITLPMSAPGAAGGFAP